MFHIAVLAWTKLYSPFYINDTTLFYKETGSQSLKQKTKITIFIITAGFVFVASWQVQYHLSIF